MLTDEEPTSNAATKSASASANNSKSAMLLSTGYIQQPGMFRMQASGAATPVDSVVE